MPAADPDLPLRQAAVARARALAEDTFDDSPALPRHLVSPEGPRVRDVDRVRRFELGSREINDRKMDMGRIDQAVELGTTEIWEVENTTGTPHSFHTTTRVRILESGGEPPPPSLCGPKDTVYVPPGGTMRLLTSFEDYADPALPYMFHCHILEHEDRGMMGQFVVSNPSNNAPRAAPRHLDIGLVAVASISPTDEQIGDKYRERVDGRV